VLPPEEEDRLAPAPTGPRGRPVEIGRTRPESEQNTDEQQPAREGEPSTERETAPPTARPTGPATNLTPESIFGLPPENVPPTTTPSPPATAPSLGIPGGETPSTAPLSPPADDGLPPLGEPMGDEDLPPALPFASAKLNQQSTVEATIKPAKPAPKVEVPADHQDDPPPALPTALASTSS
jgi:hypothetical protein